MSLPKLIRHLNHSARTSIKDSLANLRKKINSRVVCQTEKSMSLPATEGNLPLAEQLALLVQAAWDEQTSRVRKIPYIYIVLRY